MLSTQPAEQAPFGSRRAPGELLSPRDAACEQQAGDIHARDDRHEQHQAE